MIRVIDIYFYKKKMIKRKYGIVHEIHRTEQTLYQTLGLAKPLSCLVKSKGNKRRLLSFFRYIKISIIGPMKNTLAGIT